MSDPFAPLPAIVREALALNLISRSAVRDAFRPPPPLRAQRRDGEAMRALYAQVPEIACQGKCWDSCGPIRMSPWEEFMTSRAGVPITPGHFVEGDDGRSHGTVCTALDVETLQCQVYGARPMICRLWGVFRAMRCPHGCVPDDQLMDDVEAMKLLALSEWYGGEPGALSPEQIELHYNDPDLQQQLRDFLKGKEPVADPSVIMRNGVIIAAGASVEPPEHT